MAITIYAYFHGHSSFGVCLSFGIAIMVILLELWLWSFFCNSIDILLVPLDVGR